MANRQKVYPETCGNLSIMGDDRQITIQTVFIYSMISVAVEMPTMKIPYTRQIESSVKVMKDKGISFRRLLIPFETNHLDKVFCSIDKFLE